ncbi:MAG TPA: precorrin-6y C5,15-methyltransferase (decarboxylating) subunit CbiE [Gemmataceae bacterium]|nr:precorrin-6y C5,15-methyltransferase (decarboxylating) subunit CbiE [Gemmataceae bacterium]
MIPEPVVVIGLGAEGPASLSPPALDHIRRAGILAGGQRHLELFPDWKGERIVISADLDGFLARLKDSYGRLRTVVLASGDPLYFGIGRALLQALPREDLVFLPHVSSVQLAFARLKETWNDACVVSVHGRPMESLLPALAASEAKIAVLTDAKNDPHAIARYVRDQGFLDDYNLWVCENLGAKNECITRWSKADDYSPLNIVVFIRKDTTVARPCEPLLGIPDHTLAHRPASRRVDAGGEHSPRAHGLITKREIRLMVLGYLELQAGQLVWDIGAGSGAVSIEAARLSPSLEVHAIDKEPQARGHIKENVRRFRLVNVRVVAGEAPEILAGLPDPDRIFIGGSGGRLLDILETACQRLNVGGRMVLNCITLESFTAAWSWLSERSWNPQATSFQLAHAEPLGKKHSFEPDRPLFIIRAEKPAGAP